AAKPKRPLSNYPVKLWDKICPHPVDPSLGSVGDLLFTSSIWGRMFRVRDVVFGLRLPIDFQSRYNEIEDSRSTNSGMGHQYGELSFFGLVGSEELEEVMSFFSTNARRHDGSRDAHASLQEMLLEVFYDACVFASGHRVAEANGAIAIVCHNYVGPTDMSAKCATRLSFPREKKALWIPFGSGRRRRARGSATTPQGMVSKSNDLVTRVLRRVMQKQKYRGKKQDKDGSDEEV
ncbi:unnamed protein product, partial [Amoebophrya sp. A25]